MPETSGVLTLDDDDHLIVDVDDRAGDVLVEASCWESGSMCGGWSTWRLVRLESGTLVQIEEVNEAGGVFRAVTDSSVSDLDAVEQFLDDLASDFALPTHETVWAQARLGIVVDRETDVDPHGSETLLLEQAVSLSQPDFDELVAHIERRFPTTVAALRDQVTGSAPDPA